MNNSDYEMYKQTILETWLSGDDQQDMIDQLNHMKRNGTDLKNVEEFIQQIEKKSKEIYERFEKCCCLLNQLKDLPNKTNEQEWFIDRLDNCIDSAESDYMTENCDDFDMGLKLMNEHLYRVDGDKFTESSNSFSEMVKK